MRRGIAAALADFARFQAAWFGCVLLPHPADIAWGAALLAAHLIFIGEKNEWKPTALCALTGAAVDSLWGAAGVLRFGAESFPPGVAPLWLVLLWAHFGATLRHSLAWLEKSVPLAATLGAVAGPLAYFGGAALTNKAEIASDPAWAAAALSLTWLAACVALPRLAKAPSPSA